LRLKSADCGRNFQIVRTILELRPQFQDCGDNSRIFRNGVRFLLNNTAFPNLPVPLPVFRQALDSFSALIVDAEDGGKKSISAKNKQRAEVIRLYTLLGHYVEATCNNDSATFNTSGFTAVVKTKTAAGTGEVQLDRPRPEQPNSGQTVVKVENQNVSNFRRKLLTVPFSTLKCHTEQFRFRNCSLSPF
jgi:hypothetical protein